MIARIRPETRYAHLFRSLYAGAVYQNMLEEKLKAYFGVEEVLLTHGGRVGLYYLLKALPQKKVYLPAYTCWAVPDAIKRAGKELEYVDIKLEDYNMDVEKLSIASPPVQSSSQPTSSVFRVTLRLSRRLPTIETVWSWKITPPALARRSRGRKQAVSLLPAL